MARGLAFLALFAALVFLRNSHAEAAEPPGPQVFGALPVETAPSLSPNGHWLAWIEHRSPQGRVVVFDLAARKVQRNFEAPERNDLRSLHWCDEQTLLIGVSASGFLNNRVRLIAFEISGGAGHEVLSAFNYLVAWRTSKPHTMIVATDTGGAKETRLLEVDTRNGSTTLIREGGRFTVKWVVDGDGSPVAREDWESLTGQYRVYAITGPSMREVLRHDDAQRPEVGGALPNGRALVLLATNGRSHQAAWALPLDGSPLQLLADEPGADITGVLTDPYSGAAIGVFVSGAEGSVHWLDPAAKTRYDVLARAFPNRIVEPYSWTEDGKKTLVRVSSASQPPVYHLVDFESHRADIVAEEYPDLSEQALAEVKEITYKARDGTDILGYLAHPSGKTPQTTPLALVVLPHAWPHDRDYLRFDPLVQFLATRGYLVLQPQFRGSSGFGDAFREAGDRQWGRLMQDDLTDGVQALVTQGLVDPHRVCIVGTSGYSGYAALAGAAFTPELYACAVSINGLSDLGQVMDQGLSGPFRVTSTTQSEWKKLLGSASEAKHASPINVVNSIKAPILLMYGADPYTAIAQSQSMAKALQGAGKSVRVVTLPMDAEWSVRTASRVQVMQELEQFLRLYLQAP